MPNVSADLTSKLNDLPPYPVSSTVSTYGRPITSDTGARDVYAKITNNALVRIPLQWNNGNPCSSAGGGPRNISGDDWVNAIKAMGAKVQIVIGGSQDNNFSASDAANLAKRYQPDSVVIGNEFDNGGMSTNDYINKLFKPSAQAIRDAAPNVKIVGPAQASFKGNDLQTFITQCKGLYDVIDFHNYGTGTNAPDDATLMNVTNVYENEINQVRGWLRNAGQGNVPVQVGEFNLSWQYNDGYKGNGETRFFSSYNTAWSASALGHMLRAGGRGLAYSQQNGPLGIMVEPGNQDQGKPDGTPQPIYYGLQAFTGNQSDQWPAFGNAIMNCTSDTGTLECYAGSSGNIVLVNKSPNQASVTLNVKGAKDGTKTSFATNASSPYNPQTQGSVQLSGGKATLNVQGYQVVTIIAGIGSNPPPDNQPPTASFTATTSKLSVSVDGTGSSDPDGTIASYAWDLGDGNRSSGPKVNFTYAKAGTYTIKLTVTDDKGATGSTSKQVTVSSDSGGRTPASKDGMPIASNGTTGDVANTVQRLLVLNGYTQQSVNGGYGVTTTNNVKDFQTANNLEITGNVEQTTYNMLVQKLMK